MRVSAPRGFPGLFTSAFGPKVMVMHPGANSHDSFMGVPTIDVQDRTITFEPQPNTPAAPIYIPVSDDRLFALDIQHVRSLISATNQYQPNLSAQKPTSERADWHI